MHALPREEDAAPRAGRWRRVLLLVVVVLFTVLAVGVIVRLYSERSGWSSTATAIGDYRKVPLSDGSTLELNTASEVRYRFSEKLREVELTAGEARFRVAHDAERPFVVFARGTVIRAVGTEFTVRIRDNGKVETTVSEGVIDVSRRVRASAISELLRGRVVPMAGGTAVPEKRMITDDRGHFSVVEMTRTQVESRDAWRNNLLIFEEMPLRDIVEEFNRYDRRKLEIADPEIGSVLLGGRYRPRDAESFLHNLAAVMDLRVTAARTADGQVLLRIQAGKPGTSLSPQ